MSSEFIREYVALKVRYFLDLLRSANNVRELQSDIIALSDEQLKLAIELANNLPRSDKSSLLVASLAAESARRTRVIVTTVPAGRT